MGHLMKLAEVLRDIAEEHCKSDIEQALDLCTGFANRVSRTSGEDAEFPESLWQSIIAKCSQLPN
jgi:hypothetical protein